MRRWTPPACFALALSMVFAACSSKPAAETPEPQISVGNEVGQKAPQFALNGSGGEWSLKSAGGAPVVLVFYRALW